MLNIKFTQKLQQKLSPQQIQVIKMLEIPAMLLEQRIKAEMEDNPALEMAELEPDTELDFQDDNSASDDLDEFSIDDYMNEDEYASYKTSTKQTSPSAEDNREIPFSVGSTFSEFLQGQIGMRDFNDEERMLAQYILGNIDENGYLRREISNIVDDLAFSMSIVTTEEKIEAVLKKVQEFDPPGIGARDLKECLLLQIVRRDLENADVKNAQTILTRCFEELTKKHYPKIRTKLNIDGDELRSAIDVILKLNPKPGSSYSDPLNKAQYQVITPDFILEEDNGELELSLNAKNAPELRISNEYAEMLQAYKKTPTEDADQKQAVLFVKQKLDSARWFIDAIKQRRETLQGTMQAIIQFQHQFFVSGDETDLRPMILKDIADVTNLDVSTISRVANSKHIQTHFGIFPLKYFFSEGLQTDSGEEASSREIKKILQDCIIEEDKSDPLTDEKLAEILQNKGYHIARRTVAKYREQLNIAVGRLRKEA